MSWVCPTCGANNSCWSPSIFSEPRNPIPRDVVLEAASQGLVNALKALSETVPEMVHKITYFEASPTANAECQKRWKDLNDYVALVNRTLQARRSTDDELPKGTESKTK